MVLTENATYSPVTLLGKSAHFFNTELKIHEGEGSNAVKTVKDGTEYSCAVKVRKYEDAGRGFNNYCSTAVPFRRFCKNFSTTSNIEIYADTVCKKYVGRSELAMKCAFLRFKK